MVVWTALVVCYDAYKSLHGASYTALLLQSARTSGRVDNADFVYIKWLVVCYDVYKSLYEASYTGLRCSCY